MTMFNLQEARRQLSRLLTLAEAGEEVVIARRGKPVARLVRVERPTLERRPGTWRGSLHIADDFDGETGEDCLEALTEGQSLEEN